MNHRRRTLLKNENCEQLSKKYYNLFYIFAPVMKKMTVIFLLLATIASYGARPKIAVVFGGGGAKGAAEVGALKVIERAGIPVDLVVGTSIGSIVGGLYACGYTSAQLDTMFRNQEWLSLLTDRNQEYATQPYTVKNGVTYIFGFPVLDKDSKGFGVMKGERIEQMLDSMSGFRGNISFDKLKIPFRCVAVDFMTTSEYILAKGSLAKAIRASMAIPGIFKPVDWDGAKLVDGGMMNNLPTDVAKNLGAEYIIAIDLQQSEANERNYSLKEQWGIGGLLDWVVSRPDVKKYKQNVNLATVYIHPPLPDYDASSFGNKNSERMMLIGEQEAMKHWQELMALKEKLLNQ